MKKTRNYLKEKLEYAEDGIRMFEKEAEELKQMLEEIENEKHN